MRSYTEILRQRKREKRGAGKGGRKLYMVSMHAGGFQFYILTFLAKDKVKESWMTIKGNKRER